MNILKVKIELSSGLPIDAENHFWEEFIQDAIEKNNLQYGGLLEGYAESDGDFEINNTHKEFLSLWLEERSEVSKFYIELCRDET